MSAARNMVRALRQGGLPASGPPPARLLMTAVIGVAFGAIAYLAAMLAIPQLPSLAKALQGPPPPVHYLKPRG